QAVVTVRIIEPDRVGGFTVLQSYGAALSRPVVSILESVDAPTFDAFDRSLQLLTDGNDQGTAAELAGNAGSRLTYFDYCTCGGRFRSCGCFGPDLKFTKQHPSPAPVLMPALVIQHALKQGHRFTGDPQAALGRARATWRPQQA